MGQVIQVPDVGLDYLLYGDTRPSIEAYLQSQMTHIPQTLLSHGSTIYQALQRGFNYINNLAHNVVLKQLENLGLREDDITIYALTSFREFQNANLATQRWIMANPSVRAIYLDNSCDGYSATYMDVDPGRIGPKHYDYMLATDGVLMDEDDRIVIRYFDRELYPGDRELTTHEKHNIQRLWAASDWLLENTKFDFTNPTAKVKRAC